MGTAHSQHSASVRVSPVCGYLVNAEKKSIAIHSGDRKTENIHVSTGSEPHLASVSIKSAYKQAGSNINNQWNSRRKDFGSGNEAGRLSANGMVYDCSSLDCDMWIRNSSKKKLRHRALKQVSHNSTNSSYIADYSPDRSAAALSDLNVSSKRSFTGVNSLNRISSTDATFNDNKTSNDFQSPSMGDNLHGHEERKSNLFKIDPTPQVVQRRHLSELCLHLDGLSNGNNHKSISYRIPLAMHSSHKAQHYLISSFLPTFDIGTKTSEVGSFIRMAPTTTSLYAHRSRIKSPSCQESPEQSALPNPRHLMAPRLSQSPLSSEVELPSLYNENSNETLDNHNYYVNIPQSRSQSVRATKKKQQQPIKAKKRAEEDEGRIPVPIRRFSKTRWRFMSRGKNLTKSLSCYTLKFFGQQNRNYESSDQLRVSTSQYAPPVPNQHQPQAQIRPSTLALLKRGRGDVVVDEKNIPSPTPSDLGQTLQRVLQISHSDDKECSPNTSHINSLQSKIDQELMAQRHHAVRWSVLERSTKDGSKRDKLQLLQSTSTKELLHCLSVFILRQCNNLCEAHAVSSPLNPEEIISWIRDIDRALIQQGWTDVPFLSPANVVFLFTMIKGIVDSSITCSRDLHSLVMVCLYLSYGYMGNEISYPLKPFLKAQILYSMLHENDPQRFRGVSISDPMATKNPKVLNRFRDAFWETCVRVLKSKSKDMLQLNSDAAFFTQSIAELRSYASSSETMKRQDNSK